MSSWKIILCFRARVAARCVNATFARSPNRQLTEVDVHHVILFQNPFGAARLESTGRPSFKISECLNSDTLQDVRTAREQNMYAFDW